METADKERRTFSKIHGKEVKKQNSGKQLVLEAVFADGPVVIRKSQIEAQGVAKVKRIHEGKTAIATVEKRERE